MTRSPPHSLCLVPHWWVVCLPEEPDWWEMASSNMMGRHLVLVMFITTSLHSGTWIPENVICGVTRGPQGKKERNNNHPAALWGRKRQEGLGVQRESWKKSLIFHFLLGRPGDFGFFFWERLFCRSKMHTLPSSPVTIANQRWLLKD